MMQALVECATKLVLRYAKQHRSQSNFSNRLEEKNEVRIHYHTHQHGK